VERDAASPSAQPSTLTAQRAPEPSTRLVTLTGPGGTGKTRLAIETARRLVEACSGAVWFVPLAELADPGLVPEAVLGALGEEPSPDRPALEQAAEILSRQPSLLILDNF